MNTRLLRRIAQHIGEEPKRLYMHTWIKRQAYEAEEIRINSQTQRFPRCGTTACIAGWAVLLNHPRHRDCDIFDDSAERKAKRLLSIDSYQADLLFSAMNWPSKFLLAYNRAKTAKGRASAAIRRIEHFIKTRGKE